VLSSELCSSPVTLGYSGSWPPYIQVKQNNQVSGADLDVLKIVLARMGCQLTTVNVPINRLLRELELGTIDIASGASMTTERQQLFHFSIPYRTEVIKLMYDENNVDLSRFKSINDIIANGNLVALNTNAWYGEEIESIKSTKLKTNLVHVNSQKKRLELFVNQRVEGIVEDELVSCTTFTQSLKKSLKYYSQVINQGDVHFIFSQKSISTTFVDEFNGHLRNLRNNNEMTDIFRKHTKADCIDMVPKLNRLNSIAN